MKRTYLILGASSDLAIAFLKQNDWHTDDIILMQYCNSIDSLKEVRQILNCTVKFFRTDFLSMDSLKQFIAALEIDGYIPTHILHIPALPVQNKRFTEYTWTDVENQLNVQVRSLFLVLQMILPKMVQQKYGKVVIILSAYTMAVPPKFLSVYIMVKYALMGMAKALAVEYASKNIQVNMVSPSMMETKFISDIYEPVVVQSASSNPMKRNASVDDVVSLLQYLFSDVNTFITGANIPVTGGEVF